MEIGSMGSMAGMMGMQGMQGMQGGPPPPPDAEEMSSNFVDALDSDGDGALSLSEFAIDGDTENTQSTEAFDALDTNEDGFVSQDELEADMKSKLDDMKAKMESGSFSGIQQNGSTQSFEMLMGMVGSNTGDDQAQGAQQYGRMQESMFGGGKFGEQTSLGLNLSA